MSGIYQVTSDDINQLMKQTVITEEHASELLLKNHGDIVQCILDNCNFKDDYKSTIRIDNETQQKFSEIKTIVDDKNKIYHETIAMNQVNSQEIKII